MNKWFAFQMQDQAGKDIEFEGLDFAGDLDELKRNIAKYKKGKFGKGLSDIDIDDLDFIDANSRKVKAVTIFIYETSVWKQWHHFVQKCKINVQNSLLVLIWREDSLDLAVFVCSKIVKPIKSHLANKILRSWKERSLEANQLFANDPHDLLMIPMTYLPGDSPTCLSYYVNCGWCPLQHLQLHFAKATVWDLGNWKSFW